MHDVVVNDSFVQEFGLSDECLDVLEQAADRVHDRFNAIAPRRTGNMVGSTGSHPYRAKSWQVDLVVNIYYAKFVEAGTRYMRAQHNLRRALEMVEAEVGR